MPPDVRYKLSRILLIGGGIVAVFGVQGIAQFGLGDSKGDFYPMDYIFIGSLLICGACVIGGLILQYAFKD